MNRPGIYGIRNTANDRIYVGSAADVGRRWATHRYLLRERRHHSVTLQRSWDKYGAEAFDWIVIELAPVDQLIEREQAWMDFLKSAEPRHGFNIARKAGSPRGVKHSADSTVKRLATLAARSAEQKAETSEKLAAARRGYKHSPETLAKMRGQKRTEETRRRIGDAHRGRSKSPEWLAKIAATLTGRKRGPQSADTIAKRVAATRATKELRRAFA